MLLLGFFFLLWPGEYAYTSNENAAPFHFCDAHLLINARHINALTATQQELNQVTYVALEFTTQKNGLRGELVGLGKSRHQQWCLVVALIRCITHLRTHNALPTTPIYSYYTTAWNRIDTTTLTYHLRLAVTSLGHSFGLKASDISIHSLHSSGDMALLCTKVDMDMIRLLGQWHSNEMLRYLHVQTFPIVAPLALQMLHSGHFTLIPNQGV
jgi:hypothetical protein